MCEEGESQSPLRVGGKSWQITEISEGVYVRDSRPQSSSDLVRPVVRVSLRHTAGG